MSSRGSAIETWVPSPSPSNTAHVEQVLGDVAPVERCQCRTVKASASKRKSWFSR
jgi:hypothetical protein